MAERILEVSKKRRIYKKIKKISYLRIIYFCGVCVNKVLNESCAETFNFMDIFEIFGNLKCSLSISINLGVQGFTGNEGGPGSKGSKGEPGPIGPRGQKGSYEFGVTF